MDTKIKVGVIIVDEDGRALLIKEKLAKNPTPLWNIVKGSHDSGETIFTTAIRECKEEASLDVTLIHSLGVYVSEEADKRRVQFNFLAHADGAGARPASAVEQELHGESVLEVRWFTKEELSKMLPEEFISLRAYELLRDWVEGKEFPLEVCKQVDM
ncbi:MAG: hypothetical protein A2937_03905 [Candidatus Yonathbacteria bacterium RIFCSPLOWO2_01_FULL_47_33b]|uniref:Nudix hydrolase domain-containing protein n=1 Tax=Candidatus Yonathbacteria bacterium RIFCSPLOWO2_01_FULL_47_33b TaxID=1802727 RepID=A0A1G2SDX2_9BACT|nr:MAG: hypothetical protein A2937_03905 [Candidatus Yonathbacteria bacterium RIFCSPLOWO2_01_FULL_47_33b]